MGNSCRDFIDSSLTSTHYLFSGYGRRFPVHPSLCLTSNLIEDFAHCRVADIRVEEEWKETRLRRS